MSDKETDFLDSMKTAAESVPVVAPEVEKDDNEPVIEAPAPIAAEVPSTPVKEPEMVPVAAVMAEREKRQKEQKQREALEQKIAELTAPKREPPPDFYQDPEANIGLRFNETKMQFNAAVEELVRDLRPDYDEVTAEVLEYAQYNPAVREQIFAHPNPALAMYNLGKKLREGKAQQQDPDAYRKSVEAEVRKQLEAEYAAKASQAEAAQQAKAAMKDAIPPDISGTRSATAEPSLKKSPVFNTLFD